jgi:hypothetical protein
MASSSTIKIVSVGKFILCGCDPWDFEKCQHIFPEDLVLYMQENGLKLFIVRKSVFHECDPWKYGKFLIFFLKQSGLVHEGK